MNLNRIIRLKLMLLFALLQCMAPVAHAHVNGNNFSQHAHVPTVHSPRLVLHSHEHHESGSTGIAADEQHSAVVSMPPEFRNSLPFNEQPDGPVQHGNVVPQVHSAVAVADYQQQILASFPYQHPCSQAPPVQYS